MTRKHQMIRAALFLSLAFWAANASAQTKIDFAGGGAMVSGDIDLGGQKTSVSGSKEKFQEYRDLRDGFLLNELRLNLESESKPYYFDFLIKDATRGDESYKAKGGAYGKWDIGVSFDRTPHNFNTGTLILDGAGNGRLTVANQIQVGLQAVEQTRQERGGLALVDTTGEDAQQQAIIRNILGATDPTTFRLERERAALTMGYNVTPEVKTWVKVNQELRDGARSIGAGTYERYSQGAAGITHTEDQFVVTGMELADPINYRTTTFNAGGGIYKKSWQADLEYTLTDFDNSNSALRWGNPFRTTDLGAKDAVGGNANNYDRGRFVTGQMSLAPKSQSHDVSASGSVELPMHSRFTGNLSYGMTSQNELLLPYTLNSGIAGIGGAPANVTDVAALPTSRFNGEIRTITQSYALTTKPTEKLGASLKYRYYDYSNRSESILFPGYAAFGESYWRVFKNDVTGANDGVVRNDPASYVRQTAKLSADYQVAQPVTVEVDALWDRYDHKNQRIDGTNELGAGAGFVYKPAATASLKGSYHYARRAMMNYKLGDTAVNPEATGLVNYNWADRVRHRADMRFDASPAETVSFGVGGQYQDDSFGASDRFGLKSQKNLIGSVDATYEPSDKVSLTASYSRERRKGRMQSGAKDDAFDVAGSGLDDSYAANTVNPFNYWDTEIAEDVDTLGFEAALHPIPEKL
ncbi:MAG: MtrB/PioB family outer membrane beta-barrel protein, partial [Elusimicrobia bacterium]|nr:MtrB/PioB family outer membrane beta-barrel protein [Elusimicrobiota bacterium]